MKKPLTTSITILAVFLCCSVLLGQNEKPVVAVMEFDMAARRAYRELGSGLSDMLTNALVENGNFRVVERKRLIEIQQEQQMGLTGSLDPATSASIGRLVGAGYLVMGTITEFKENESGGIAGTLLRSSGVGVGMYQSHIGFTIRIVNSTTGEIVTSKSVDKKVNKVGLAGGSIYGIRGGGAAYKSQAMEDAIEQAIKETVQIIGQNLSVFDANTTSTAYTEGYDAKAACANFNPASMPKIMVVIPEVHLSGRVPDPAGETEIIRQLVELGFNVVDQQQIAMIREQEMVTNAINDPQAAASLGVEFGADVIIVGEAFSEFAGRNNNMISCRARVEARAINTRTGRILATDGHHGSGIDISENIAGKTALKNAGSTLGNYLISQLCEKYDESSPVTTTSAIEIMASNVDFMSLKKLTDYLESVSGVSNVQKSMTGNVGRINLQYSGKIDALAEAIVSRSSLGFEITGFADNKLEMAAR